MLLTAVAMGMMFMSSTETSINSNFKSAETAYFAARAGVEEVRDRALVATPNTISAMMPTTMPGGGITGALYVLQNGVTMADVQNINGPYGDTEFCHDFNFPNWKPANLPCGSFPAVGFSQTNSVAPYALDYKWVRVTLKANNSAAYCVDGSVSNGAAPCGTGDPVCWNGVSEVVLPAGLSCNTLSPIANPVYLVTSLAITPSGARRLVQQELAQTPIAGLPYGLFATGTGCASLKLSGGAQTYSFSSATEATPSNPPSNWTTSGGNVGSNGNIGVDGAGTSVNGTTGSAIGGIGNCNQGNGISATNGAGFGTASMIPTQTVPVPPMPNPLPPTNNKTYNSSQSLPPGAYGNVNITGNTTITLAGGNPGSPAV